MIRSLYLLSLLSFLLLGGCTTTYGRKIDMAFVRKIERGVTTKAEVRRRLGKPKSVSTMRGDSRLGGNMETWMYYYAGTTKYYVFYYTASMKPTSVQISFKGNTVSNLTYSEGNRSESGTFRRSETR